MSSLVFVIMSLLGRDMGEIAGEMTGEINEVQNPRNPFVQGISRVSTGEMGLFFTKHTKNRQCKRKICMFMRF